jgi:hypothetical protein
LLLMVSSAPAALADEQPLRDPMRPFEPGAIAQGHRSAERRIVLTGILVSENRRIAVIDNQLYRVGDHVNGNEIIRIDPRSIRIRRGAEEVLIALGDARTEPPQTDGDQNR